MARPKIFEVEARDLTPRIMQVAGFVLGLLLEVRIEHLDHCEGRNLGLWDAPGPQDSWFHIAVRVAFWYPINGSWHVV